MDRIWEFWFIKSSDCRLKYSMHFNSCSDRTAIHIQRLWACLLLYLWAGEEKKKKRPEWKFAVLYSITLPLLLSYYQGMWDSLVTQLVKNLPAKQETPVWFPGPGRSSGGGIGYPLQHSWASLVSTVFLGSSNNFLWWFSLFTFFLFLCKNSHIY